MSLHGLGICQGHGPQQVCPVEESRIEEVGRDTLGLECEGAKLEGAGGHAGLEEVLLVLWERHLVCLACNAGVGSCSCRFFFVPSVGTNDSSRRPTDRRQGLR